MVPPVPVPLRLTGSGDSTFSLDTVTLRLPLTTPAAVGANVTSMLHFSPAASCLAAHPLSTLNGGPLVTTSATFSFRSAS